jgi:short subunit dehydrogenase-like uncharacterized protein
MNVPAAPAADRLLVYGATGYTGGLLAALAKERGLAPIVAGRNRAKVEALAARLGADARVATVDDAAALREMLRGVACVISSAGPFARTARQMFEACLEARTHYLDVTGEIDVFALAESYDERARQAGVMLLPGIGFDVVPSDCLAAHVAARVEQPRSVRIALAAGGTPTHGTAKTALQMLSAPLRVRRGGRLVELPSGSLSRRFDFGEGPVACVGVPMGDVVTAGRSTGAPDVEVYMRGSTGLRLALRTAQLFGPILSSGPVQGALGRWIDRLPEGPSEEERLGTRARVVAEAESGARVARARIETPSGYETTRLAGIEAARRILAGEVKPGFQTPATAFGADFVLSLPGVKREDLT